MPHSAPAPSFVRDYVRRLSTRVWALHALRSLPLALASSFATLLVASRICEPILTARAALVVGSCAGLAFLVTLALLLRKTPALAGPQIARVLERQSPALASRLRSALELAAPPAPDAQLSPELTRAHIDDVAKALAMLPREQALPWSTLMHASSLAGLWLLLVCVLLGLTQDGFSAFTHALFQPAPVRADGTRVAHVVEHLRVRLTFPGYLRREPALLVDPTSITAPRGTNIELHVEPSLPMDRGAVVLDGRASALEFVDRASAVGASSAGSFVARVTAQKDAELRIRLERAGIHYEDSQKRTLHVVVDRVPVIAIEAPENASVVERNDVVTLHFAANDDTGIASVDLHVRLPNGDEKQRQLWSALDDGGPRTELRASSAFGVNEFAVQEGEELVLWLEAHDSDLVTGPNTGKSAEITLEVASPGKRLATFIPSLQAAADAAVLVLASRLEHEVPEDGGTAKTRFAQLEHETRAWLIQLDDVVKQAEHSDGGRALDTDQVKGMRRRNQRLLDTEGTLHDEPVRPIAVRSAHDAKSVDELERDVILLVDLLAKAHVDEAGAIADELRQLKKKIEELLGKLGKADSPEAERELLAQIQQAERRLAELSQSLSRMATRVPSEFVNREALEAPDADSTLQSLESLVRKHDLHGAAKQLEKLAQQIDQMAKQIGQGGVRLRESRFGPHDQAVAAARQQLDMLSEEQARLAGRSAQAMQDALSRAQGSEGAEARAHSLAPQAEALRKSLDPLKRGDPQDWRSQAVDRAQARLGDARDALANGDLAAANGMAQGAQQDLEQAANELENEARFQQGGNQGETARAAEQARRAANDTAKLSQQIGGSGPDLAKQMSPGERKRMQDDVEPQHKTRDATAELRNSMEKGPDGTPVSPDGIESLDAAQKAMQQAEQALQRGNLREAAQQQANATSRLQKLSQKLASEQKPGGGSGSPGQGERADGKGEQEGDGTDPDGPVHIPSADEFKGPAQMRRKLLDAMREASPTGFEAAIQRYYQELLR